MKMLEQKIKLARIDAEKVSREIGDFVVRQCLNVGSTGCVIGLSGGVDSTTTAALIKRAFDSYNNSNPDRRLELVGYMLPSGTNSPDDESDGKKVAERLGIRYETQNIDRIVEAFETTNPEALKSRFDKGNLMSRIRANVLSTKAATERKIVAGTGNRDEDFGIGYYTLFGDGAVHMSPIGNLPKRLVRELARYQGFADLADRVPTAGLEPGQTDFKDLGYSYNAVEIVMTGLEQGIRPSALYAHSQVVDVLKRDADAYAKLYGAAKFASPELAVKDIMRRHEIALGKATIIDPPKAPVTLKYC